MQNLTISMSGAEKPVTHSFPVDAFAGVAPEFAIATDKPQFVVGLDATGQVRRVVSQNDTDRAVVAALVGTWVAAGLKIQYAEGFVALAKLMRKAVAAEKDEAKAPEGEGGATAAEPVAPVPAAAPAAVPPTVGVVPQVLEPAEDF